ncbi:MAG: hypothetical protein JWQ04_3318 [Pedosphaera sp.]|nr:hypothetical protein [Pedosphaera sp.]
MAIFFLLGAIGGFGLARRDSFQTQSQSTHGAPVGEIRTVQITKLDRVGYRAIGTICVVACIYCIARIRRDALRS